MSSEFVDAKETLTAPPVTVTVTPEFGFGYGSIDAPIISDEQAEAEALELTDYLEPASAQEAAGCIDGRCLLHTLDGRETVQGPKLAGGNAVSLFMASALSGYFNDGASALEHFAEVVSILEQNGRPVRFHGDSRYADVIKDLLAKYDRTLSSGQSLEAFIAEIDAVSFAGVATGCGMNDGLHGALAQRAARPITRRNPDGSVALHESDSDVTKRLAFIKQTSQALHGEAFDAAAFDAQTERASDLVDYDYLNGWSSIKALLAAEKVLRSGGHGSLLERFDVLEATQSGVHGHTEWAVAVVNRPGHKLNTTAYYYATGKQVFGVETWLADVYAADMYRSNESVQLRGVAQAVVDTQLAGYVGLGNGRQRAVILS